MSEQVSTHLYLVEKLVSPHVASFPKFLFSWEKNLGKLGSESLHDRTVAKQARVIEWQVTRLVSIADHG